MAPGTSPLTVTDTFVEWGVRTIVTCPPIAYPSPVINLTMLPILGLIHASTVRRDLRLRAGPDAPVESMVAKRADSAARGFAVALVTVAVAIAVSFLIGAPGLLSLVSLG